MFMTTKTITITIDAYEILKRHKMSGESFSEVVKRELAKGKISDFAGAWSHLSDKTVKEIEKDVEKMRKRFSKEVIERSKSHK